MPSIALLRSLRLAAGLTALCWLLALPAAAQGQNGFKLVVNAENQTTSVTVAEAARLFLKKTRGWDHGVDASPVDQAPTSRVRESFSKTVHRKTVSAIEAYWRKMIFSGRKSPPPVLDSDRAVIQFVLGNPGAVGYVSSRSALPDGVKTLRLAGN